MNIVLISSKHFTPKSWSGGKTTELFIYPTSSKYSKRDFNFRLSTATVEVETSMFTPLHGISRTLMVLDGEMTLSHIGQHTKTCRKFEVDKFDGGWKTSSAGKCTDFNLMTNGRTSGTLEGIKIKTEQSREYVSQVVSDQIFIYVSNGQVSVMISNILNTVNKGDLLVISEFDNSLVTIHGIESSELVLCNIVN